MRIWIEREAVDAKESISIDFWANYILCMSTIFAKTRLIVLYSRARAKLLALFHIHDACAVIFFSAFFA